MENEKLKDRVEPTFEDPNARKGDDIFGNGNGYSSKKTVMKKRATETQ